MPEYLTWCNYFCNYLSHNCHVYATFPKTKNQLMSMQ